FMNSLLDFLGPAVGCRRSGGGLRVGLRAAESGHVLSQEAAQRIAQLVGHLARQHRAAEPAGGLVGAHEGDAGWTLAEVIFEGLGPIGGEGSLDVLAEEVDAFLAVVDRVRQRGFPARLGQHTLTDLLGKMHGSGSGFDNSLAGVTWPDPRRTRPVSRAGPAARGAAGSSPRARSAPAPG